MSGAIDAKHFELTQRMADNYLRRKDIPQEFYKLEYWDFIIKILNWQGIKAKKKVRHTFNGAHWITYIPVIIVEATQKQIWEALSGLPGHDKFNFREDKCSDPE